MARLQLFWNDPDTQTHQQYTGSLPITIGRAEDNTLVLSHRLISRYHARLERRSGKLVLLDQKSQNGTFINGERVTQATLRPGDSFVLAEIPFTLFKEPLTSRIRSRLAVFWPSKKKSPAHAVVTQQGNQLLIDQANEPPLLLEAGDHAKMGSEQVSILANVTVGAESDVLLVPIAPIRMRLGFFLKGQSNRLIF